MRIRKVVFHHILCRSTIERFAATTYLIDLLKSNFSLRLKFACVAPADVDKLYFINFPHQVCQILKKTVSLHYLPGVSGEATRDASAIHEMQLNGPP